MNRFIHVLLALLLLSCGVWSQTRSRTATAQPAGNPAVRDTVPPEEDVKPAGSLADWATTWLRFGSHTDTAYGKIGSIQLGFNFYLRANPMFINDTVKNTGVMWGVGFPVRVPYVVAWYNVKFVSHGTGLLYGIRPGNYWSVMNEIMIGKNFVLLGQPLEYIPHIGFGFDNGIIVVSLPEIGFKGYQTHYYLHWNIGIIARKMVEIYGYNMNMGITFNFEQAFFRDEDTKQRMNLSLIVSY